jgi:protein TonB
MLRHTLLLVGALVLTLACFLVLPLLNTLGSKPKEDLELRGVGVVEEPPPPPPEIEEEEEEKEEPKPELAETPEPLDLSQLEMALNPGGGGDWGGDFALDLDKYVKGAGAGDSVLSMADLDQRPRPLYQPSPMYPPELQKQKIGGTVVIVFVVEPDGRVGKTKVKSSPNPILERQALAAIKKWKFEPGRRGGKPVAFRMRVPITFAPN